ncbi:hypothetical protein BU14_2075s0002 [Porphyra umbilicalis]|uniref:Uncharacterized protein n=1 Tax=Porphyra umbilicalis TaxID=2786 RepID=A0A1X6NKP4_PORUM|nr:hypothetical protein BU14_2075s0002 [Porphyra umbilicalis]|eukprot:OSX68933.1 hypothetical protein BU14_2075s0002 [Porphyra umbilicalis]
MDSRCVHPAPHLFRCGRTPPALHSGPPTSPPLSGLIPA